MPERNVGRALHGACFGDRGPVGPVGIRGAYQGPIIYFPAVYELYATSSFGGPLIAPPLATLTGVGGTGGVLGPWWSYFSPGSPLPLTGGASYALQVRFLPGGPGGCSPSCAYVGYDNAGIQPLPYQLAGGTICPTGLPASGQLPFGLRFRGASCGPGPQASLTILGNPGCASSSFAYLTSTMPPVLGAPWFVTAVGPINEPAYLFWSIGVVQGGLPIPGSQCPLYLDPVSLQALALLGAEPLASGTLSTPTAGWFSTTWGFLVPASPTLAGASFGAQVLVVGPLGSIPLGGGALGRVTNALQLTLGY